MSNNNQNDTPTIRPLTDDLAIISKLGRIPNSSNNLSWEQLRNKYDESALAIQKYINEKLIPDVTTAIEAGTAHEIDGSKIKKGSIPQNRIVDPDDPTTVANAITYQQIATGTIKGGSTGNIGENQIDNYNIGNNAVRRDQILDGEVIAEKLGTNSVITGKIMNGNVTGEKLSSTAYEKIIADYKDTLSDVAITNPTVTLTELPTSGSLVEGTVTASVIVEKFAMKTYTSGNYDFYFDANGVTHTEVTNITSGTITFTLVTFQSILPSAGKYVFTYHSSGANWDTPALTGRTFSKAQLESQCGIVYTGTPADGNTITITLNYSYTLGGQTKDPAEYGITIVIAKPPYQGCGIRITLDMKSWSKLSNYTGDYCYKGKFKLSNRDLLVNSKPSSIEVFFSREDAESGIYSSFCESGLEQKLDENGNAVLNDEEETLYNEYGYIFANEIVELPTTVPPTTSLIIPTVITRRYVSET